MCIVSAINLDWECARISNHQTRAHWSQTMNTQCCMLIGWEHNETRSRAKISSHTLRQGVSSNRNQSMMVSLHHHGNNNQLKHVNKWNLNECVHMWTLDGNSKQPFPTVNKTNIQLQLKTWQEDQVTLQKYLIHTWFKILFSIFIFNIHSFSFIFIHKIYVHNFGPIGPYSSTESASKWGKGPSHKHGGERDTHSAVRWQ